MPSSPRKIPPELVRGRSGVRVFYQAANAHDFTSHRILFYMHCKQPHRHISAYITPPSLTARAFMSGTYFGMHDNTHHLVAKQALRSQYIIGCCLSFCFFFHSSSSSHRAVRIWWARRALWCRARAAWRCRASGQTCTCSFLFYFCFI